MLLVKPLILNMYLFQNTLWKAVNKYIFIQNGVAKYFQDSPLPTSANLKAHNFLKEILEND